MKTHKKCTKCRIDKHFSEFTHLVNNREILHYRCKECLYKHKAKCKTCGKLKPRSEFHRDSHQQYGVKLNCKPCMGFGQQIEYTTYFEEHKQEIYADRKLKRKIDPLYKLSESLRGRLSMILRIKKFTKNSKFKEYLGCSVEDLKKHIESKFQPGMSWSNHSLKGWHIDHIMPLSLAKTPDELIKLCHYSNLQPLWARDNILKGNKIQS